MTDQELIKAKKQVAKMRNVLTVLKRINDDAGVVFDSAIRLQQLLGQLVLQDYDDPFAGSLEDAVKRLKAIRAKLPSPVISFEDYDRVDYALTLLSQEADGPTSETKTFMALIEAGLDKVEKVLREKAGEPK